MIVLLVASCYFYLWIHHCLLLLPHKFETPFRILRHNTSEAWSEDGDSVPFLDPTSPIWHTSLSPDFRVSLAARKYHDWVFPFRLSQDRVPTHSPSNCTRLRDRLRTKLLFHSRLTNWRSTWNAGLRALLLFFFSCNLMFRLFLPLPPESEPRGPVPSLLCSHRSLDRQ